MAPGGRPNGRRGDPNSGYWIRMRQFERTLLRNAYTFAGHDMQRAATTLGMPYPLFVERAAKLGGVTDETPREPHQWETWSRKRRTKATDAIEPEPIESEPDDDGDGHEDEEDVVTDDDEAESDEHEDLIDS